jgi:hypothetical protein
MGRSTIGRGWRRIALCGAFNRFNDALQIQIEPEVTPVSA